MLAGAGVEPLPVEPPAGGGAGGVEAAAAGFSAPSLGDSAGFVVFSSPEGGFILFE